MGLCSRRPTRVPLLTKRYRQLRLQWDREHRDWTMDEWKRVAWSDESRFLIHHIDGRVRVCRLPGEQLYSRPYTGWWWRLSRKVRTDIISKKMMEPPK
ncbi:hypothetical protein AVEN_39364-1 [Araneus ventricosus]|uniref:Transposase Tc1-like domain-containing protein n=1 Tax=Araneus ventricosus TaxID=182803 RepID=A0A4Y2PA04_ARAVE|nr:hypothetical protein AVEN_39364-1 [Araneus ventricosus]